MFKVFLGMLPPHYQEDEDRYGGYVDISHFPTLYIPHALLTFHRPEDPSIDELLQPPDDRAAAKVARFAWP